MLLHSPLRENSGHRPLEHVLPLRDGGRHGRIRSRRAKPRTHTGRETRGSGNKQRLNESAVEDPVTETFHV